jgi:hypothetical protein
MPVRTVRAFAYRLFLLAMAVGLLISAGCKTQTMSWR